MSGSTPRLSEVARELVYPQGIVSTGWPRIQRRLSDMAVTFDGWQVGAGQLILGRDANGKYVATVGGVTMSLPRQIGKTFTVGSLLVAMCLEYPGLRVVWTSHHLRTTTNTFRAMQGMVRRKRIAPHLAHNGIRTANGEQEIRFSNGSIIMFGAREHGFGVGIDAIDVLVCDEAQRLTSRALADMVPTTNQAKHQHGALLFFIGTPPRPTDSGDEFGARRAKALAGTMLNGIYIEAGADPDGDFDSPEQWRKANWSYPHRTPHESMLRLRENLTDPEDWRREGMGVWDEPEETKTSIFGAGRWEACAAPREHVDGEDLGDLLIDLPTVPEAIGVAVSVDREWASIAAASLVDVTDPDDPDAEPIEKVFVTAVDRRPGVDWLPAELHRIQDKHDCLVVIDEKGPTKDVIPEIEDADVAIETRSLDEYAEACSRFFDKVRVRAVVHPNSTELDDAVSGAVWRTVGDRQVWGRRKSESDVSMLEAATLAAHAAELSSAFTV